jgi:hypothetical protein
VLSWEKKEVNSYALTSSIGFSGGGGRSALGGQPHTDARDDQVHFERGRGDCSGFMAVKHFRIPAFDIGVARRQVSTFEFASMNRSWH